MATRKKNQVPGSKKPRRKRSTRTGPARSKKRQSTGGTAAAVEPPEEKRAPARRPASRRTRAKKRTSLAQLFEALAAILVPYALLFESEMHPRMGYCLRATYGERPAKEVYFGGVKLEQDHVSYHLFLLYSYPELEQALSPALRQRQEGKTSFLIERGADGAIVRELGSLTRACYERFKSEGQFGQDGGGQAEPGSLMVI